MMKKNVVLLFLLIGGALLFAANGFDVFFNQPSNEEYELNFILDDYRLSETVKNGVTYSTLGFEGSVVTTDEGYAELPFIHATLQLSASKNVSLEVISSDFVEYDLAYPMLPSRGVIYRNQDPASIPYEISQASIVDEFYPANLAEATDPFILRSVRGTNIYVYPFQYNAAGNVLRVYNNLTVRMTENNTTPINPLPLNSSRITREMHFILSTVFVNYDVSRFEHELDDYGSILVIYTARDAAAIEPWIQWKREKGYIVYTEEVTTGTNVTSLVASSYQSNNDILYVQLVGDWADIQGPTSGGAAVDPNLGCVVGGDAYPDLIVGRFSANSANDVTVQVNKSITYEQTPQVGETWYSAAVGIASSQGPGDDNETDNVHIQNIYDNKLDPFTYSNHSPIYDPSANPTMVATAVNNGASIMNYCGHGSMTSWVSSGFNNSHVNMLTNGDKLPFIISVACVNGAFDDGECFAEAWLKKDGGGAVGMFAATINQSWDPPMRGQDYVNDLLIGGYDYSLYTGQNGITTDVQKTTYGAMCFNGAILMTVEDYSGGQSMLETWHVFGDASLQVRTDTPSALLLSNQVVLMGVDFTTIVTTNGNPVEGAMVSFYQNDEVFTGITDASGAVTISHTMIAGDAQLTVTAFNTDTIYDVVAVIPPGGPYLLVESYTVTDDNNNIPEYDETINLDMNFENVGTDDAIDVSATLSTEDDYVNITIDNTLIGDISAGAVVSITDAFEMEVADDIPDQHTILFTVEMVGSSTWTSTIFITFNAPLFECGAMIVDDSGGDGMLDPGDTATLQIPLTNIGNALSMNIVSLLSTANPDEITIINDVFNIDPLDIGEEAIAEFDVQVSSEVLPGTVVTFLFVATGGEYIVSETIYASIGLVFEDFETGDFSMFDWQMGTFGWEITSANPYEGVYSAKSSAITHNQTASLSITMDVPSDDEISFYRKVSSENNYDYLRFYINGNLQEDWAGEIAWGEVSFDVAAGNDVTFQWDYYKDYTVSNGSDCAWIDYIVFPGVGSMGSPIISLDVNELEFGTIAVGQTATQQFTISNDGDAPLTGIITSPEGFTVAQATENQITFTIAVGDELEIDVEFAPTEAIEYSDYITINSNDTTQPMIELLVHGIGDGTGTDPNMIPVKTELTGNYPNPFNPTTTIGFALSSAGHVTIEIFNIKGAKITTLLNDNMEPGYYTASWNGQNSNNRNVASGIYFYKMRVGGKYTNTRKMILLK